MIDCPSGSDYFRSTTGFAVPAVGTILFWWEARSPYVLSATLDYTFAGAGFNVNIAHELSNVNNKWGLNCAPVSLPAVNSNQRYHFAGSWNATNNLDIYQDGVNIHSSTQTNIATGSGLFYVGSHTQEDFRVYNRKLSAAEIATIYASRGTDNIRNGLLYQWRVDEGATGAVIGAGGIKETGPTLRPTTVVGVPKWLATPLKMRRAV